MPIPKTTNLTQPLKDMFQALKATQVNLEQALKSHDIEHARSITEEMAVAIPLWEAVIDNPKVVG